MSEEEEEKSSNWIGTTTMAANVIYCTRICPRYWTVNLSQNQKYSSSTRNRWSHFFLPILLLLMTLGLTELLQLLHSTLPSYIIINMSAIGNPIQYKIAQFCGNVPVDEGLLYLP